MHARLQETWCGDRYCREHDEFGSVRSRANSCLWEADGLAVLFHGLGVELLHRPDGQGEVRTVQDLRPTDGAVAQGEEGQDRRLSDLLGRGRWARAVARHLVPDDLEP